jgi:pimeloyl-ACP methyl ester carboxylesterase
MGLGSLKTAWQRQTLYFGHEHGDKYSVLVIDNRGMGDSDKPLMRYSTSEMARDAIEVLVHVGWVQPLSSTAASSVTPASPSPQNRQIHLAGISMGGMIAQEIAMLIPDALSSLTLICTAAAIENTTTFVENMSNRASMLVPRGVEAAIRGTAFRLFPEDWLVGPDDMLLPEPGKSGTVGVGPPHGMAAGAAYGRFENRYQRIVAEELHKRRDAKRFGTKGFLLQMIAAGWHHKSPEQLKELADRVGRERIMVMHGTEDAMISVPHGRKLIEYLKPAEGVIVEGMGHVPVVERREWFHRTLEERITIGEELDGRA